MMKVLGISGTIILPIMRSSFENYKFIILLELATSNF